MWWAVGDPETGGDVAPAAGPAAEDQPRERERESVREAYLPRECEREFPREPRQTGSPPPRRCDMS